MNAFDLIALKQKVGREYADDVELFVLAHFDAAKRGKLGPVGYNFISRHLVQAYFIAAKLKDVKAVERINAAANAWRLAGGRPGDNASLTTGEYKAMCDGLKLYFRALPKIEVATYRQACNVADQAMA